MASSNVASFDQKTVLISNLRVYYRMFCEHVECEGLLIKCRSFMNGNDISEITSSLKTMCPSDVTRKFLDMMLEKYLQEPGVWKQFLEALSESGYTDIARILTGECDYGYDEETQRNQTKIIDIFAPEIEERLSPSDLSSVLSRLTTKQVIQKSDKEKILNLKKHHAIWVAYSELFNILPHYRIQTWYSDFLATLLELEGPTFKRLVYDIDPGWYKKNQSQSDCNDGGPSSSTHPQASNSEMSKKDLDMECETDFVTEETKLLHVSAGFPENDLNAPNPGFQEDYNEAEGQTQIKKPKLEHNISNLSTESTEKETSFQKSLDRELFINDTDAQSYISEVDNTKADQRGVEDLYNRLKSKVLNTASGEPANLQTAVRDVVENVHNPEQDMLMDSDLSEEDDQELVEKPIILRDYQKELTEQAMNGKNVIICAPTGSGKTIVALKIIQNHLSGFCNKIRKVVFLVNQVPLAVQQHKACKASLPMYKSKVLAGQVHDSLKVPFGEILKKNDILVMTAQSLIDSVVNKDIENVGAFTLMVFDECHHTHSNHPFNQLMHYYMELKFSEDTREHNLPQILGLTASLGVGKAKSLEGAMDHVKKLMANLDTEVLATVDTQQADLASHVNIPKEEIKNANTRRFDPFRDIINGIMVYIESHMANYRDLHKIKDTNPQFLKAITAPSSKGCATYTEWVSKFLREVAVLRVPEVKRFYMTCYQHLTIYNDALIINADCRSIDAVKVLFEEFSKLVRDKDETDKLLTGMLEGKKPELEAIEDNPRTSENPKLLVLKKMILEAKEENPDLRGIVFVRTRLLADCLENWMTETPGLNDLNPVKFVGATVMVDKGGMTKHQQINIMKYFKDGKHQLIIATSIAQEGLDISKCNLVIRYDHVTNEIALVQSRGRARAEDSSYKVIGQYGTGTAEKEEINLMREQLMRKALRELKKDIMRNTQRFSEERVRMQMEAKVERELKAQKNKYRTYHEGEFELLCIKCDEFCCLSSSIRVIEKAHHVVIDESFLERVRISDHPKPISYAGFQKKKRISCKKCNMEWGVVCIYCGVELNVVSLKSLVIKDFFGNRTVKKKWNEAPFQVRQMDIADKQKIADSFKETE